MRMRLADSCPFDLDLTLCCGQAFRWEKRGEWWCGVVGEKAFKIRQNGNELAVENADADLIEEYFGLRDNLPEIYSQIGIDEYTKNAISLFAGLRILRQEPWECLISYICATCKNIAAIKHMILNLSRQFGERIILDGHAFHTFPAPETLAKASAVELTRCRLGYRAKYVHKTAKMVHESSFDLNRLRRLSYEEARRELQSFPGVGLKVADCALLFSLDKLQAFPVDVWIRRAILRHYSKNFPEAFVSKVMRKNSLTDAEYKKLSTFGQEYFGKYAGYAQEYLYHYERTRGRAIPCSASSNVHVSR